MVYIVRQGSTLRSLFRIKVQLCNRALGAWSPKLYIYTLLLNELSSFMLFTLSRGAAYNLASEYRRFMFVP